MRSAVLAQAGQSARPGFVRARAQIGYLHAFLRLLVDPRKGIGSKLLLLLAAVYVVMPVDLVPDLVPIVGWLDDLGFVSVALGFLARSVSQYRAKENAERALPAQT